ncbi:MAG TPA: hypothetical protein VEJ37_03230 [Xanthobacteraceae bacterium]|nr:hypothetical protein [Xanthobacteraceae bacterium]
MDKRIAGLLGAAAALTAVNTAPAATPAQEAGLAPATSYRELLDPIPNAVAALKSDEAQRTDSAAGGEMRLAYHHHHHHHHHRRHYHHHHHHHW